MITIGYTITGLVCYYWYMFRRPKPRTARYYVRKVVLTPIIMCASLYVGITYLSPAPIMATPESPSVVEKPSPIAGMMEKNGCYTGDAPARVGEFGPSKALVTLPGKKPRIYPADVGYSIWLEGAPGTLHAFCEKE